MFNDLNWKLFHMSGWSSSYGGGGGGGGSSKYKSNEIKKWTLSKYAQTVMHSIAGTRWKVTKHEIICKHILHEWDRKPMSWACAWVKERKKEDELKGLFGLDFQWFDKLMNNDDMCAISMGIVYSDSWLVGWLLFSALTILNVSSTLLYRKSIALGAVFNACIFFVFAFRVC